MKLQDQELQVRMSAAAVAIAMYQLELERAYSQFAVKYDNVIGSLVADYAKTLYISYDLVPMAAQEEYVQ